jgi:hypothetical protein
MKKYLLKGEDLHNFFGFANKFASKTEKSIKALEARLNILKARIIHILLPRPMTDVYNDGIHVTKQ